MRWNALVTCETYTTKWPMGAFEKRCGEKFDGPSSPFGTLVEYTPTTAKDKSRTHQFGQKTLNGIFSGYVLRGREVGQQI